MHMSRGCKCNVCVCPICKYIFLMSLENSILVDPQYVAIYRNSSKYKVCYVMTE